MYDENRVHSGSRGDRQNLEKPNSAFIFGFYVKNSDPLLVVAPFRSKLSRSSFVYFPIYLRKNL